MAKGYVVGSNKCLIPSYDAEQIEEISGYFIGEWSDGNPNNEDRTGRFVTSSNNSNKIELANADSYVSGVSEAYEGNTKKAKVNPIGLSVVQDDGTLVAGDKCMPSTNGIAKKSSNNLGYRVVGRVDNKHVQVIVSPNNDMVQRIKANVLTYEEIQASTDLTGKIASASSMKKVQEELYSFFPIRKQGTAEATFTVNVPLDSLNVLSWHENGSQNGGVVIFAMEFYPHIISSQCHNNGEITIIGGNVTTGISFKTNSANTLEYRLISIGGSLTW